MSGQDSLFGHAEAQRALIEGARSGRLHHAWLVTGPEGIGKMTLARRFARWLLAGQPGDTLSLPNDQPAARQIAARVAAGTHADMLTVGRAWDEKKQRHRGEIVVEDARRIAEFLRLTPAEGGWRVVLLDEAETLNRNAANALLKVLEEPPPRTVMLLVSSVPGRLLPTIRSRCRLLRLEPLDETDIARALDLLLPDIDPNARHALAALSHGSPGRAVRLAGEQAVALDGFVRELLDRPRPDPARDEAIVDAVLKQEEGFASFLLMLGDGISARVREAARSGTVQAGRIEAWQTIRRIRSETERFNLEKRQALATSLRVLTESH